MAGFSFEKTDIDGVYLVDNFFSRDKRGGFVKCFEKEIYSQAGIEFSLNETFVTKSSKNVLRGLHFQINNPQAKLVGVVHGRVWDVVVDLRPQSKTYKKWICAELNADNCKSYYIPRGFAHGFVALEDDTLMLYQCDGKYDKETDTGIIYNDPQINIDWPINIEDAIISDRDKNLMSLSQYELNPMKL